MRESGRHLRQYFLRYNLFTGVLLVASKRSQLVGNWARVNISGDWHELFIMKTTTEFGSLFIQAQYEDGSTYCFSIDTVNAFQLIQKEVKLTSKCKEKFEIGAKVIPISAARRGQDGGK